MTFLSLAAVLTAAFSGCTETEIPSANARSDSSILSLSISGSASTKLTGTESSLEDNRINSLDIFIFRGDEEKGDYHALETHRKFTGPELGDLTNIEIQTTAGKKDIAVVANAKTDLSKTVQDMQGFRTLSYRLEDEEKGNLLMTGSCMVTVSKEKTSASISLTRMAARIVVDGIRTDFSGTAYEGKQLEDVKIYVINAKNSKLIYNGNDTSAESYLNRGGLKTEDMERCSMEGILHDDTGTSIGDDGYATQHHFYCFGNENTADSGEELVTRLIIEGTLNGIRYYYPVNVNNSPEFTSDHKGIRRNTVYTIGVTIKKIGSDNPDKPLESGSLDLNIGVSDWILAPETTIIF